MSKILLIEDDTGMIPLSLYIEQSGYSIVICQNGNDALELFTKEKPALVILDINLPGKNGIEICEEIR